MTAAELYWLLLPVFVIVAAVKWIARTTRTNKDNAKPVHLTPSDLDKKKSETDVPYWKEERADTRYVPPMKRWQKITFGTVVADN